MPLLLDTTPKMETHALDIFQAKHSMENSQLICNLMLDMKLLVFAVMEPTRTFSIYKMYVEEILIWYGTKKYMFG